MIIEKLIEKLFVEEAGLSEEFQKLEKDLKHLLDDKFVIKVGVSRLSKPSVFVTIYGKNPTNNIPQNSRCWMTLWMHDITTAKPSWESTNINRLLKFRKITASNVAEANNKLVAWFKKSKAAMIELDKLKY